MIAAYKFAVSRKCFLLLAALPHLLLAQTTVTLSTSPNPSVFGAPVVLKATVTPSDATGRVTFYDGVAVIGIAPISSGTATLSTVLLPSGIRRVKAYYGGDAGHPASTSNIVIQAVNAARGGEFAAGSAVGFSGPAPNFFPIGYVSTPAVGDFNGDGKQDVAFIVDDVVYIRIGTGNGSFNSGLPSTNAPGARSVNPGDFNGDGKLDLLLVNASNIVSILLGNGDGSFQPAVAYGVGQPPQSVALADFNGDGKVDFAVASTAGIG